MLRHTSFFRARLLAAPVCSRLTDPFHLRNMGREGEKGGSVQHGMKSISFQTNCSCAYQLPHAYATRTARSNALLVAHRVYSTALGARIQSISGGAAHGNRRYIVHTTVQACGVGRGRLLVARGARLKQ
jgi:hypothetical protein